MEGKVLAVSAWGDLTVRTMDGRTHLGVRLIGPRASQIPRQGQDCLVIGDGAKFFCLGVLERRANEGDPLEDPLVEGAFELSDVNELGLGARIRGSAGEGIIFDTGGKALVELNAALGMLTEYLERRETLAPGFHAEIQHDGESAWASYTWRDRIDLDSLNADFEYEEDRGESIANTVHLDVFKDGRPIALETRLAGEVKLSLTVTTDGSFELDLPGRLTVSFDGELRIESEGMVKVTSSEKIVLEAQEVYLGDEAGADKVALASKVDSALESLRSTLSQHQHAYASPGGPAVTAPTVPPTQIVATLAPTGASKTSAT